MSKEEIFWNWFKANSGKYYHLNQIVDLEVREKLLDQFLNQLHAYCDKLYFEIGGFPDGSQELIISAEGNKDYFPVVEALVSKAPKIDDWEIIAFKPPMGVDFVTEYEGVKLDPSQVWFLPLENDSAPQSLGLRVCFPKYNLRKEAIYLEGCYQLLDTILGEKSVALDIQHVEVAKLPRNPESKGLIEMFELPKYIAWRKTKV